MEGLLGLWGFKVTVELRLVGMVRVRMRSSIMTVDVLRNTKV